MDSLTLDSKSFIPKLAYELSSNFIEAEKEDSEFIQKYIKKEDLGLDEAQEVFNSDYLHFENKEYAKNSILHYKKNELATRVKIECKFEKYFSEEEKKFLSNTCLESELENFSKFEGSVDTDTGAKCETQNATSSYFSKEELPISSAHNDSNFNNCEYDECSYINEGVDLKVKLKNTGETIIDKQSNESSSMSKKVPSIIKR